jgi:hypothetical protein
MNFVDDIANMRIGPARNVCAFSPNRKYRYKLSRTWNAAQPLLVVIMLNPSVADEFKLDPTVTRVVKRAMYNNFGGVVIHNLFALVSTYPKALKTSFAPIGQENDVYIAETLQTQRSQVCVAWGPGGAFLGRERTVLKMCYQYEVPVSCLGLTDQGFPRHPLHVAYSVPFQPYAGRFAE